MRLATFNLESLDLPPKAGLPLEARAEVLRPALERLEADVLCLQEVNGQHVAGREERALLALDQLLAGTRYAAYARLATTGPKGRGVPVSHTQCARGVAQSGSAAAARAENGASPGGRCAADTVRPADPDRRPGDAGRHHPHGSEPAPACAACRECAGPEARALRVEVGRWMGGRLFPVRPAPHRP